MQLLMTLVYVLHISIMFDNCIVLLYYISLSSMSASLWP